jgi:hypothetical protein
MARAPGSGLMQGTSIKTASECGSIRSYRFAVTAVSRSAWLIGSTLTPREDPSHLAVVVFSRLTYRALSLWCGAPRLERVELIHRLVAPSNLNSRDENDGIERWPDRFD